MEQVQARTQDDDLLPQRVIVGTKQLDLHNRICVMKLRESQQS